MQARTRSLRIQSRRLSGRIRAILYRKCLVLTASFLWEKGFQNG
ncbi:MAG: hypothetical protein OXH92_10235 [Bryobacterales bacterium]|nr:hypothetical protein [Bryobacterales bacterium]MDE0434374.1 hypothetical protein [Bryobacterales bacterium]